MQTDTETSDSMPPTSIETADAAMQSCVQTADAAMQTSIQTEDAAAQTTTEKTHVAVLTDRAVGVGEFRLFRFMFASRSLTAVFRLPERGEGTKGASSGEQSSQGAELWLNVFPRRREALYRAAAVIWGWTCVYRLDRAGSEPAGSFS